GDGDPAQVPLLPSGVSPLDDVAAVVVNYRTAELTVSCVANLRAEGVGEIVVVDAASGDDVADPLAAANPSANVFVPLAVNRGYGAGVNAGVARTTKPYVVISNPDLTVAPGTIAAL